MLFGHWSKTDLTLFKFIQIKTTVMADDYANYVAPAVICAAQNNDYEEVNKLLSQGHDPNALDELNLDNPLIIAIHSGNTAMANTLLDAGANPNYENADGENALHAAVRRNNFDLTKRLVEDFKMDVNHLDGRHYSPLHVAIMKNDTHMVGYLLSNGADPNELTGDDMGDDVYYETAIHSVKTDNVEMVEMLINAGAQINNLDSDGMTPLMWACCKKHTNVALYLIRAGANITYRCRDGLTALHEARRNKLTAVIDKLCG